MADQNTNEEEPKDRLNPVVFYGSVTGIVLFCLWTMIFTQQASTVINAVKDWIADAFGWYYFLIIVVYLIFVMVLALSRFGRIRLGPAHSRPEFNLFSWAAMLFSAGIGIGVIFFAIAEPLTQLYNAPNAPSDQVQAARYAMELTFFHWGISGWAVYSLIGMALGFFSYRYGLPLTIRSPLYPLFGERINGWIGHTVDIAAVLATVFGIAAGLGIGIIQLNFGLHFMFGIAQGTITQVILVVMIVAFATISAATGVERGIRRLSEFNILLAVVLLVFVLVVGKTMFLLNAFVMNVGDYISHFVSLSTGTYAFDRPTSWLNGWTLFFWAWWIAWGPFVGLFLARISRGRTIAEFVAGTMTLPIIFMMIWMSLLGNSAMDMAMNGGHDFGQQVMANPPAGIYLFLSNLPWAGVSTVVVSILGIIFFVTSGDSGALVLSNFTSYLKDVNSDAPVWMRVLWSAIIGIVTLALVLAGGLHALQAAVVIAGLPFSFVMLLMMAGLWRALKLEIVKQDSQRVSLPGHLSSRTGGAADDVDWRKRLARAMTFPDYEHMERYLEDNVRPAMQEVRKSLMDKNLQVDFKETGEDDSKHLSLHVGLEDEQDFIYQIWPVRFRKPTFVLRVQQADAFYYRLEVYLNEGSQGYDLMGYSKAQVIDDILDQYESHLNFLHLNRIARGGSNVPDGSEPNED